MKLILIRHARPERIDNADRAADPGLTDVGHRQSRAMAEWLAVEPIDAMYVSPMRRARQTSDPLEQALGMEAVVDERVREYDSEANSYIPVEDMRADKERWKEWIAAELAANRDAFVAECVGGLDEIVDRHSGQSVAVVCHGGVINAWAAQTLGIADNMFFEPDYTSIHRFLASSKGHRSVVSLNETAHLRSDPSLQLPTPG